MKRYTLVIGRKPIRWLWRLALVPPVLLGACLWADSVLQVADRGAEMVMTSEDLESFVESEEEQPLPKKTQAAEEEPGTNEPEPTAATEVVNTDDKPEPPAAQPSHEEELETPTAIDNPEDPVPNAEEPVSKTSTADLASEVAPPVPASDESAKTSVEEATTNLPLSTGQPGNLASFAAAGGQGAGAEQADGASPQSGLIWDVELSGRTALADLQTGRGVLLAAVRQRHHFVQVALTRGPEVSRPLTLEQFLDQHPEFSGRHGIILARRWLRPFNERLLSHGGGWEMWLLLEDRLFADWVATVERAAAERGWTVDDVERIEAIVTFDPDNGTDLNIGEMHRRKEATREASGDTASKDTK